MLASWVWCACDSPDAGGLSSSLTSTERSTPWAMMHGTSTRRPSLPLSCQGSKFSSILVNKGIILILLAIMPAFLVIHPAGDLLLSLTSIWR
jgi:hypothetical protein